MLFFVDNKDDASLENVITHFDKALKTDHYRAGREWAYKNIKRYIFAEEFIPLPKGKLFDYKFFCFNGSPRFIQVDSSRFEHHKRDFYDLEWNHLDWKFGYPNTKKEIKRPEGLSKMIEISERLSHFFPFCRVDLYNIPIDNETKIRFGELTFYPEGATGRFQPEELNTMLGEWIDIKDI